VRSGCLFTIASRAEAIRSKTSTKGSSDVVINRVEFWQKAAHLDMQFSTNYQIDKKVERSHDFIRLLKRSD